MESSLELVEKHADAKSTPARLEVKPKMKYWEERSFQKRQENTNGFLICDLWPWTYRGDDKVSRSKGTEFIQFRKDSTNVRVLHAVTEEDERMFGAPLLQSIE